MASDSFLDSIEHQLNPVDLAKGLWDGAIGQPAAAIAQLAGKQTENAQSDETLAYKAGQLGGMALDFAVLSRVGGGLLRPLFHTRENILLGKATETLLESTSKLALTGGVYGGLLTPSNENQSLLTGRLEGALVGGTMGGAMGGTAKWLQSVPLLKPNTLLAGTMRNAIAGGVGGVPAAYETIGFNEHRLAEPTEVLGYAGQSALFGAAFGAADHGFGKLVNSRPVQDKYYSVKRDVEKKALATKYNWYSGLDQIGMRHPLQRVGDLFTTRRPEEFPPKVALTAVNNPAAALDRELPQFFQDMETNKDLWRQAKAGDESWNHHLRNEEIQTNFAHRLLNIWHGTSDMPGFKWHTDAELATDQIPVERVAQMRKALLSNGRAKNRVIPIDEEMDKLLPDDFDFAREPVLNHINHARARFYGFDDKELTDRMFMPKMHARIDHDMKTPVDWSPIVPQDPSPRYFHATNSRSLDSALSERMLYSGRALRERALAQTTGESVNEDRGRGKVSIARSFPKAWDYYSAGNLYLDDYPVVYGLSGATASRARLAGSLERGELLLDKARIGDSWLTRLGLRKPEITHIYVPDMEVQSVTNKLFNRRIRGVQVVGLSDLKPPQYKPEQTEEEAARMLGYIK